MNPTNPTPAPVDLESLKRLLDEWWSMPIASKHDEAIREALRNAAPALIDEVEQLREQVKESQSLRWFSICHELSSIFQCEVSREIVDEVKSAISERDSLRRENEELRCHLSGVQQ